MLPAPAIPESAKALRSHHRRPGSMTHHLQVTMIRQMVFHGQRSIGTSVQASRLTDTAPLIPLGQLPVLLDGGDHLRVVPGVRGRRGVVYTTQAASGQQEDCTEDRNDQET